MVEGGVVYLVRTDHIGRPVFATTMAGTVVWRASYLPFGGVHVTTGAPISSRFPGQWFQAESGLHQNWMRDYDPTTGRYLQADPLGLVDGASVYGYVTQSPMMLTDPTGLESRTHPNPIPVPMWPGENYPGQLGESMIKLFSPLPLLEYCWNILFDEQEEPPESSPEDFRPIRGTPAKENTKTGEVWEKDKFHKDHWEVYKNRKDYEKGRRNRDVWDDGRPKGEF